MVRGPSRRLRLDAVKAGRGKIQFVDKDVDRADGIVFTMCLE